jgi:AICAR transformylase/IMP cyclohydrolase PurH
LLVAFGNQEGSRYLRDTLTTPINYIFNILGKCEMDAGRIKNMDPDITDQDLAKTLKTHKQNLENAGRSLFDYIFDNKTRLPQSILAICGYLAHLVSTNVDVVEPTNSGVCKEAVSPTAQVGTLLFSDGKFLLT